MTSLKLRIPPPLVAVGTAGLMWLVARAVPVGAFSLPGRYVIAASVAVLGISTALAGVAVFRRAGTTVNPFHPERAARLVVTGVYRFTRNPMYLGMLLVLIGWAFVLSNVVAIIISAAFIGYMNHFQIKPEEAALASTFGDQFKQYQSSVRRWL